MTDLTRKDDQLIAATQGRGFWLLDDITSLHQFAPAVAASPAYLFRPAASYRLEGAGTPTIPKTTGQNHPGSVLLHYHLAQKLDTARSLKLEILDPAGKLIRTFSNRPTADPDAKTGKPKTGAAAAKDLRLTKKGLNRFGWDMRYEEASKFEGLILWGDGTEGPRAVPGPYRAEQAGSGDFAPTEQARAVQQEITQQIDEQLGRFRQLQQQDVPALNKLVRDKAVDAIAVPKPTPPPVVPGAM
ncbi:MAG: hypothetical protein M3Y54_06390 [Bacteroidota bacterium]|nr:hypothetical protein [Bacteroidota bacterium]